MIAQGDAGSRGESRGDGAPEPLAAQPSVGASPLCAAATIRDSGSRNAYVGGRCSRKATTTGTINGEVVPLCTQHARSENTFYISDEWKREVRK